MARNLLSYRAMIIATLAFVAVGTPTGAADSDPSLIKFSCSGTFGDGETGECVQTFRSTESVYVDSHSAVARLTSIAAAGWKVQGLITDGVGNPYFTWSCEVDASSVAPLTGWSASAISSCRTSEFLNDHGYAPPHPGTHTIRVTATADVCAEAGSGLCPFTGSIKLRPGALD